MTAAVLCAIASVAACSSPVVPIAGSPPASIDSSPVGRPDRDYGTWFWNGSSWAQLASTSFEDDSGSVRQPVPLVYWKSLGGLIALDRPVTVNPGPAPGWGDAEVWNGSAWVPDDKYPAPPPDLTNYPQTVSAAITWADLVYDDNTNVLAYMDWAASHNWVWSGGRWRAASMPLGQSIDSFAYDPYLREVLILSGGETWGWNGSAFTRLSGSAPSVFNDLVAAGDGKMLTFDFDYVNGAADAWDGNQWLELPQPDNCREPSVDLVHVDLVYDAAHAKLIAVAQDAADNIHMFSWTGLAWKQLPVDVDPPPGLIQVAYDPELHGIVLTDVQSTGHQGGTVNLCVAGA